MTAHAVPQKPQKGFVGTVGGTCKRKPLLVGVTQFWKKAGHALHVD